MADNRDQHAVFGLDGKANVNRTGMNDLVSNQAARGRVREFLTAQSPGARAQQLWVRPNSLASGKLVEDLHYH